MTALADEEIDALVEKLADMELLHEFSRDEARSRLRGSDADPDSETWLLPALMQLTDRDGRGFEQILFDVLLALSDHDAVPAARLLTAVAVCQASHVPLPSALGARVLEGRMDFAEATDALADELAAQLDVPTRLTGLSLGTELRYGRRLYVHHDVVAEAFAQSPRHTFQTTTSRRSN